MLVLLSYVWLPGTAQAVVYDMVSAGAAAAALVAAVRSSGRARLVWGLLAAAQVSYTVADGWYNAVALTAGEVPIPHGTDVFYLADYPLAGIALLLLSPVCGTTRRADAFIDALVAGTAATLLLWILLRPAIFEPAADVRAQVVSLAYPAADLILLVLAARLVLGPARRSPSLVLLVLSLVLTIVADVVFAVSAARTGGFVSGTPIDLLWLAAYLAFALAALHPSRSQIVIRDLRPPALTRARVVLLVAAGLLPAAVFGLSLIINEQIDLLLFVAGTSTLYVLLLVRVVGLAREQARMTDRERILREAGTALVVADTAGQLYQVGQSAATQLVDGDGWVECSADAATVERAGRLVIPLAGRDGQHGALAVTEAPAEVWPSLDALAAQVTLALDAARREEQRFESERRFRSIVQTSSDVLVVLRPDRTVAWCGDSIEALTGYRADELTNRRLAPLVAPDDRSAAEAFMASLESPGSTARAEIQMRMRDGTTRVFDLTGRNLIEDPAVRGYVLTGSDITDRRALEDQLRELALRDQLTGLANRARLLGQVRGAMRRWPPAQVAVIFIDLDDFKLINDSLGHEIGDQLLRLVGDRIRRTVRSDSTPARLGGDEFAVLLGGVDARAAKRAAAGLVESLSGPFMVGGREVFVQASVGVATADGVSRPDAVLRNADMAMYQAKASGKNRVVLFEPSMYTHAVRRLELQGDLRRALAEHEFVLHYQPVMELASGRLHGFEALVRWRHPSAGLIPPDEFIPLAEETGFIVPLGRWILHEACRQARGWRDRFGSELTMSVNVSVRQLESEALVSDVASALSAAGLPPSALVLEITESALAVDERSTVERLAALDANGVRLAIDDFGTGYSSLRYIKQFPVRELKIDQSFVSVLANVAGDSTLVALIIDLARSLQMATVAEGIETEFQLKTLRELGCDLGQGKLFAPAREAGAAEEALWPGRSGWREP
jgi:diguanylate cyclase (GGDEF)-like protein/PAS domain S-box-containing protein